MPNWAMPAIRRLYCHMRGVGDSGYVARTGYQYLPPADLRFHVGKPEEQEHPVVK